MSKSNFSLISKVLLGILFTILLSLAYNTANLATQDTFDSDSLDYHLPLVENLAQGKFFDYQNSLLYYPATTHVILLAWLKTGLPPMWFNAVFSLATLFIVSYFLAKEVELDLSISLVFAFVTTTLTPMVRLFNTFKIDVWFSIFYLLTVFSIIKLIKKPTNLKLWLLFGVASGLMIGTKYTGVVYLFFLLPVLLPEIFQFLKNSGFALLSKSKWLLNIFSAGFLALVTGGAWYLRNWWFMGDVFYPRSDPGFKLGKGLSQPLLIKLQNFGNLKIFTQAFLSEYLIWGVLVIIVGLVFFGLNYRRKLETKRAFYISSFLNRVWLWHLIAFLTIIPFFSLGAIISDMRYLAGPMILGILLLFLLAKKFHLFDILIILVFINALPTIILTMNHQPKLVVFASVGIILAWGLLRRKTYIRT